MKRSSLACSCGSHLADLVEEQGAAIGARGRAFLVGGGAGEGAADMAEDGALEQVVRDGAAVQRHERLFCAPAQPVHRFGRKLLAGAALAGDEDARRAGRRGLDHAIHGLHRRGAADEAGELGMFHGAAEGGDLAHQFDVGHRVLHRGGQPVGAEGLHQVVESAGAHGPHGGGERGVGRHHHHSRRVGARAYLVEQVDPVGVGQAQVEQHAVHPVAAQGRARRGGVRRQH
jgi:hypothetical protein